MQEKYQIGLSPKVRAEILKMTNLCPVTFIKDDPIAGKTIYSQVVDLSNSEKRVVEIGEPIDAFPKEAGFSLIELLVVMIVVGILAAFAVIRYQGVATNTIDAVQKQRLMQYADAQNKYKTVKGKRRYGTLNELKQEGLLNETVIKFDGNGNQVGINNWSLTPGTETTAYLRDHFFIKLQKNGTTASSTTPTYCIAEDGVLRRSPASDATVCNNTSPVVEY